MGLFSNRKNDKTNPYEDRRRALREQNFTDIPGTEGADEESSNEDSTPTQAVVLPAPESVGFMTGVFPAPLTPAMQAWQAPTVPLALDIDARIERYRQFSAGQQARMQVALCDYASQLEAIAKADLEENWVVDLFVDGEPILDYLDEEIARIMALRSAKEKRKRKMIADAAADALEDATAVYRHEHDMNVQPVQVPEDQQEAEKAKCWGNLQRKVNKMARAAFKEAEKSTKKAKKEKKAKQQAAAQPATQSTSAQQPASQPAAQTQAATQVTSASTQSAAQQSTATGSTSTTTAGTTAGSTSSTGTGASTTNSAGSNPA